MSDRLPFEEPVIPGGPGGPASPASPASDDAHASDQEARAQSVDPARNIVLEASAGTGKTRVLVDRYLNLLHSGVSPANILAITFTRKAAAEMRVRILSALRERAARSARDAALWRDTRDRAGEIAISTIDAFCLSLLHEFPLEADLDPGFEMADETDAPRLLEEALDAALRISRNLARSDDNVRLVFAQLGEPRLRQGLAALIERRLVVEEALQHARRRWPRDLTAVVACATAVQRLADLFTLFTNGLEAFLASGPVEHPRYRLFARDMRIVGAGKPLAEPGTARAALDRIDNHFLVEGKSPRKKFPQYPGARFASADAWKQHREQVLSMGPAVAEAMAGFRRDLNAVLSRGVWRVHQVALAEYRKALDARGVLDFQEVLARALFLLRQMEEFARSRFRLEARYHHVLLDEFQDTSRAQWELVALLIRSWGEGIGLSEHAPLPPSIFLVGDRKQSIYGFRDADVAVMEDARRFVDQLRPEGNTSRAISRSFRAVAPLLSFVNDVCGAIDKQESRRDAFHYDERDRFPTLPSPEAPSDALGVVSGASVSECAAAVGAEIVRLINTQAPVRDPSTHESRPVRPGDIAILFRTKDGHREFETALEARGVPTYVYKGLGFFEADEIKDVLALFRYLASPASDARAAELLRSRFVRLSDTALQTLAPHLALSLGGPSLPEAARMLSDEDSRVLSRIRESMARWLARVDRLPPAELLEQVLAETAYLFEMRGLRAPQARENLKKIRALVRRVQNHGYATLARLADHLDRMTTGDESNAVIDAADAVNLMTVHAAKGLEFPIVFLVNLTKGTGNRRHPIRVGAGPAGTAGPAGPAGPAREEAWISVGDFQSAADEDAKAREREETKRLLYVALTRARDRLYLSSEVKDAQWKPAPGSLGEVLPGSLGRLFEQAGTPAARTIGWSEAGARQHAFRVCPPGLPGETRLRPSRSSGAARVPDDFSQLSDSSSVERIAVTSLSSERSASERGGPDDVDDVDDFDDVDDRAPSRALVGKLVHRLFERYGPGTFDTVAKSDTEQISRRLAELVRDEELVEADDLDAVLRQAGDAFAALCADADLRASFQNADAWFEVPFSVRPAGAASILRGTFDCIVRNRDGRMTVLEIKTGRPSDTHRDQLAEYLKAARALYPQATVDGKLIYAHHGRPDRRPPDAEG